MGEVYRATDDRLGRDVALKVLKSSLAQDRDRLRRFELEARSAALLNHPNIVAIYDIGMHDGAPYIVSELLQGKTLRECLLNGPLSLRQAVTLALEGFSHAEIADALGITANSVGVRLNRAKAALKSALGEDA